MTDRPAIVGRYTWAGGHDPALTIWLGDSPHHWDGQQLVLHDEGREIRPEPGFLIVLWSDGMAHAVSPRVAERVYQPQPHGERVPLDHLNSDQYDELCNQLDRLRADIAACQAQQWPQRLGQAEKAVARVRALHSPWKLTEDSPNTYCAHCEKSGGLYRYPCPTLTALDGPGPAATQATELETTARVFAALHQSAEQDVSRVIALYEQWVKAGPPPLGVSLARWWDKRLVELRNAINEPGPAWTPPPPGSTREQLPDHLLALINIPSYLSTACEAGQLLSSEMPKRARQRIELGDHSDHLHDRCRINNKYTGALCYCPCHTTTKEN